MIKMVLASGNRHKYTEMSAALAEIGVELLFGGDFENPPEVDETGATYAENALLKARAWMEFSGLPAIADDSGIEAAALDGAPGVHSARIIPGTDADRTQWLLRQTEGKTDRRAAFVSCIAAVFPHLPEPLICQRRCEGMLAHAPSGASGFGYDPIFIPGGYDKTFSELGDSVKLQISHRALALKGIAEMLSSVVQSFTVA